MSSDFEPSSVESEDLSQDGGLVMGWAKFDSRWAMNPKLRQAGPMARVLDALAICQAAEDETDGYISTDTVRALATFNGVKRWRKEAEQLVTFGRWEPAEDGWQIHDYLDYNASRAELEEGRRQRSEAARQAGIRSGEARRKRTDDEPGRSRKTNGPVEPGNERKRTTATATATAAAASPRSTHDPPAETVAAAAAANQNTKTAKTVPDQALRVLAERHLAARNAAGRPPANPEGWVRGAVRGLRNDLQDRLNDPETARFDDPLALASWLEPVTETASNGARNEPQRPRLHDEKPDCPTCESTGWTLDDDTLEAARCPDCNTPTGTVADSKP